MAQCNLHQHSEGSFLDGLASVSQIAKRVREVGSPAVAVTDHNEVNQHFAFQKACRSEGIHPVLGIEADWVYDLSWTRANLKYPNNRSHICMLAENNKGLSNIWAMASLASTKANRFYKPLLTPDIMREYSEGVYASDGCFAGGERFLTACGTRTFSDTVGTSQQVLGASGWTEAEIKSFGVQEIYEVVLRRGKATKAVLTTGNHRWFVVDKKYATTNKYRETPTTGLSQGDRLRSKYVNRGRWRTELSPVGVQAGIVFGDGTVDVGRTGRRAAKVTLYGDKDAVLLKWFPLDKTSVRYRRASHQVDEITVRNLPGFFKDEPDLKDSSFGYLYGWLAGYFAADGCVTKGGSAVLSSTDLGNLQLAQDVCQILGIGTGRISNVTRMVTPPGGDERPSTIHNLSLRVRDLSEDFFLTDQHRFRAAAAHTRNEKPVQDWKVISVTATGRVEEVFCAVVPKGNAFTLEDNIFTGNCMITEFGRAVESGDEDRARQHFSALLDIYGDHFYSELHTWQFMEADTAEKKRLNNLMTEINQAKVRLADEMGVPIVVVNDAHHAYPEDWENKELVWKFSVGGKKKGDDQDAGEDYGQKADHLMATDELHYWMARHGVKGYVVDEAIKNAERIAGQCNAEITKTLDMPRLTDSEAEDLHMLMGKVQEGFKRRVTDAGLPEEVYQARLEEEMELISSKHFAGYFNVVQDMVDAAVSGIWAPMVQRGSPKQPMLVGPGRGSAGGCLVAYLLGITSLDPIHYDLMFERFLDPDRMDNPDIDVDFPQHLRPGTKSYLEARHGHDHVCTIQTLTRSKPKSILKDLARALKIDFNDVVKMSKIIEQVEDIETEDGEDAATWEEVIEKKGGELAQWASKYPVLFTKIKEFQSNTDGNGMVRQSGQHPSGVLLANKPLLGNMPLRYKADSPDAITQFDMYEVEEMGAVKLDLLGLRHLGTLMHARNLIYERHGIWLDFRDDQLPPSLRGHIGQKVNENDEVLTFSYEQYADPAIWWQIEQGHTTGIFQLETPDLTRHAVELKPRNERDTAALISIVRPGVKDAGLGKVYLDRRAGTIPVEYDHPLMASITDETYGVLIYQEQLLKSVKQLAGFTPGEANALRRVLSKKKMDKVLEYKDQFIDGCMANAEFAIGSHAAEAAQKIWNSIEASGRYAFNKSHAVGYAIISTWEVWVKHYYPQEFVVALMATDGENLNKYVREARRLKIPVLPPDINRSDQKFTIEGPAIRYGIDSLRGIGVATGKAIQANRPYRSLVDYLGRAGKGASKGVVYNLIKIGAFDSLGDRKDLILELEYERCIEDLSQRTKDDPVKLVEIVNRRMANNPTQYCLEIPDFDDPQVIYEIENELVGNYITVDPMGEYEPMIAQHCISDPSEIDDYRPKDEFCIGGQLTGAKEHVIKKEGRNKGRVMAFLTVQWNELDFDITVFPELWEQTRDLLKVGVPVILFVARDDRGCHLKDMERLDLLRRAA